MKCFNTFFALLLLELDLIFGDGSDTTYVERRHHVSTKINIKFPECLKEPDDGDKTHGYLHTDALFGTPFQRNREITGLVYYMTPNKTQPGCGNHYDVIIDGFASGTQIFLIDRGYCTFSQKVRLAQAEGAQAAIIINNKCLQHDFDMIKTTRDKATAKAFCCGDLLDSSEKFECETQADANTFPLYLPFMAPDGAAEAIKIPAFLIPKAEGRRLKEFLCRSQNSLKDDPYCKEITRSPIISTCEKFDSLPMAQLMLDTPNPDNRVEYELWFMSDNPPAFLETFEWFAKAIKTHSWFTPRYIVRNGTALGCSAITRYCGDLCIYDDKEAYCSIPANANDFSITGEEVLNEDVRQYCIWAQENETFPTNGLSMWWSYVNGFKEKGCFKSRDSDSCSKKLTDNLKGLDQSKYQTCVSKRNQILKSLCQEQDDKGIFAPAMIVNTRIEHFEMTSVRLASIICDGYQDKTAPAVCNCVRKASTENEFAQCRQCETSATCDIVPGQINVTQGVPVSTVFFIIVLITGLMAGMGVIYTRYAKKQMHEDVRNILAEYMPLDDVGDVSSSGRNGSMRPLDRSTGRAGREDVNLI